MATPLADMVARIRNDLHDNDSGNYRWTDAVLQRHIARALQDYSEESPLEQKTTLVTVASSRDIDITAPTALTNVIRIEKVEYPVDQYPPVYVRFTLFANKLTLLVDDKPSSALNVYVFWHKAHSLTTSATDVPDIHQSILETGAAAYAALEWANYAINRSNVGGDEAAKYYKAWGETMLTEFKAQLRNLGRKGKLRQYQIHPAL